MPHPFVVHCKKSPFDIYVGRPSKWGNPFTHKANTLAKYRVAEGEVISKHEEWLLSQPALVAEVKAELKGKVLGCWCAPKACHADTLARIANEP